MSKLKPGFVIKNKGYYFDNGDFNRKHIDLAQVFLTTSCVQLALKKYCKNKFAQNNLVFKVIPVYIY
jgi:hypothetical protein